jgi:hypothetical protein
MEQFLKENNISFYKAAQLLGKNAATCSGPIKNKLIGKAPMRYDELTEFCKRLSDFLHKTVKPDDFDLNIYQVILK